MFTLGSLVVAAFIALLVGAVIGYFINPLLGGSPAHRKELEEQLAVTEKRLADYRQEVANHFEETARKVNRLTEDYREVHEHLVKSAVNLASNATGDQFIETTHQRLDHRPDPEATTESQAESEGREASPAQDTDSPADHPTADKAAAPDDELSAKTTPGDDITRH